MPLVSIYTDYRDPEIRGYIQRTTPQGYAVAKLEVVDVWVKPIKLLSHLRPEARDRNRSTQIIKGDASVELVTSVYEGWVLVRTMEGTLGWVEMSQLEVVDSIRRPHEPLLTEQEFLERMTGVPYLHGGTTRQGIDCSGLMQRYFSQVHGLHLPRHSTDQWKVGTPVEASERTNGDLLHLRHREKSTDHVAVLLDAEKVLHSCLDRQGVVVESLTSLLERYDILGTTRILGTR